MRCAALHCNWHVICPLSTPCQNGSGIAQLKILSGCDELPNTGLTINVTLFRTYPATPIYPHDSHTTIPWVCSTALWNCAFAPMSSESLWRVPHISRLAKLKCPIQCDPTSEHTIAPLDVRLRCSHFRGLPVALAAKPWMHPGILASWLLRISNLFIFVFNSRTTQTLRSTPMASAPIVPWHVFFSPALFTSRFQVPGSRIPGSRI